VRFLFLKNSLIILTLIFFVSSCGHAESPVLPSVKKSPVENVENNDAGVIGVEVAPVDAGLMVVGIAKDSPAAETGIKGSDIIIAIDGTACSEIDFQEAVQKIRGKVGSAVKLEIMTGDSAKTIEVSVKRKNIDKINKNGGWANPVPGSAFGG